MSQFLLVVIVALFAGDAIASEASWGNLRAVLTRPVGRGRLLATKAGSAGVMALVRDCVDRCHWARCGRDRVRLASSRRPRLRSCRPPVTAPPGCQPRAGQRVHPVEHHRSIRAGFMMSTITDSPAGAIFTGFGLYIVSQILNNLASLDPDQLCVPDPLPERLDAALRGEPTRRDRCCTGRCCKCRMCSSSVSCLVALPQEGHLVVAAAHDAAIGGETRTTHMTRAAGVAGPWCPGLMLLAGWLAARFSNSATNPPTQAPGRPCRQGPASCRPRWFRSRFAFMSNSSVVTAQIDILRRLALTSSVMAKPLVFPACWI